MSPLAKFLLKLVIFLLLAMVGLETITNSIYLPSDIARENNDWVRRMLPRIEKSKATAFDDVLIIGDSVGNQLFNWRRIPASVATEANSTMAGFYLLAKNAVTPETDYIVLVSVPNSLSRAFAHRGTYESFVKLFFTAENLGDFSPEIFNGLMIHPTSTFAIFNTVKAMNYFGSYDYSKGTSARSQGTLSDITIVYLKQLQALADENGAELLVVVPPIPESWEEFTDDFRVLRQQIIDYELEDILGNYVNQIHYIRNQSFSDGIHYTQNYLNRQYQQMIEELLPKAVIDLIFPSGIPASPP